MRKVAILGCLSTLCPSYSIAGVVRDQLHLLKEMGENLIFITTSDFTDHEKVPEGVEVFYYPRWEGSLKPDEIDMISFEKYVFETSSLLRTYLKDCTTCIQHDLLFIDSFLPVGWAIRRAAEELPNLKWLHWMHSAPSKRAELEYPWDGCYTSTVNSELIYLNKTDIPKVAEMYNVPENHVRVVNNFVDPSNLFRFHPVTNELVKKFDLYSADVICIYPTRLVEAKQPHKTIKLLEFLKNQGLTVKLILCNSWSNADNEKKYLETLRSPVLGEDLIFTSEFDSNWCKENNLDIQLGVPKDVVIDLLRISDLFILPSISECCSLVMLEAGLCKNLMILNDDLYSLHEFGGQKMDGDNSLNCAYMSFGSITRPIGNYLPSEDEWFKDHANKIANLLKNDKALQFFKLIRKRHTPQWVYANQILPLIK